MSPSLSELAEVVHHAAATAPHPCAVHVAFDGEEIAVGFWPLPDSLDHPADALVGFVAPTSWAALGITAPGRMRSLDEPTIAPVPVTTTVLADRQGQVASVVAETDGTIHAFGEPPAGMVVDVLARALERPTPAPEHSPAALIELTWLDRLARGLMHRPARRRSWRWVADRHPLRGCGPVPTPAELAEHTKAHALGVPWSKLRNLASQIQLPAASHGPPGGSVADAAGWFDDGSLSRWALRDLPAADALLSDLLELLPDHVGEALASALTEVAP